MSATHRPSIVCIGANLESRIALERLLEHGARVAAVVTRPAGERGAMCDYVDLHDLCDAAGVPTIDTVDINSAATVAAIREARADYLYTLGWSQLFKPELLRAAGRYVVGSHPSALPYGRGRAPVPWTVLEGLTESALSLFRMDALADNGPLLVQKRFAIPPRADASDVYQLVAANLGAAYVELYEQQCHSDWVPGTEQAESLASHRAKRTPADGLLDFTMTAADVDRLVRAVTRPYPGAYAYYRGERVTFWRSDDRDTPAYRGAPGQVLLVREGRLLVQAADRPLWLWDLESEGAPIDAAAFRIDSRFGYRVEDELHRLRGEVAELKRLLRELQPGVRPKEAA